MLIYGKAIREKMTAELKAGLVEKDLGLAIVCAGDDTASISYARAVMRYAEEIGVNSRFLHLPASISEPEIIAVIDELNQDTSVHGIMIQAPLPPGLSAERVVQRIDPDKDVEGVSHINQGRLLERSGRIFPCTPKAVLRMLKEYQIKLAGCKICVIGRSRIVGAPLSMMLMDEDATVTLCHSRTRDLSMETLSADVVIAAAGQIGLVQPDMVRSDTIVIDVGTNFDEQGKMWGDVDQAVGEKAAMLTAVPGGVGSITVPELFDNLRLLTEKM